MLVCGFEVEGVIIFVYEGIHVACRVANLLRGACSLGLGDRVVVILSKVPQWWLINLACIRAGKTPTAAAVGVVIAAAVVLVVAPAAAVAVVGVAAPHPPPPPPTPQSLSRLTLEN